MSSNGKDICDFLKANFPRSQLSASQWEFWARDLARENWVTNEAIGALKRMLQDKPGDFLPSLPVIQTAITTHHRRLEEREAPKVWQEDPPREEAAALVAEIQGASKEVASSAPIVKYPGWDGADLIRMASWRRQHNVPPPVGYDNRMLRAKMPPEVIEEERNLYREIARGARAKR